mmetsp:Transcript_14586/g.34069  ORF Transcript_14586/g.34069 Transcript_14586/m.34069 type:complete len:213 (+) Transcript_14586:103-741(+)
MGNHVPSKCRGQLRIPAKQFHETSVGSVQIICSELEESAGQPCAVNSGQEGLPLVESGNSSRPVHSEHLASTIGGGITAVGRLISPCNTLSDDLDTWEASGASSPGHGPPDGASTVAVDLESSTFIQMFCRIGRSMSYHAIDRLPDKVEFPHTTGRPVMHQGIQVLELNAWKAIKSRQSGCPSLNGEYAAGWTCVCPSYHRSSRAEIKRSAV